MTLCEASLSWLVEVFKVAIARTHIDYLYNAGDYSFFGRLPKLGELRFEYRDGQVEKGARRVSDA